MQDQCSYWSFHYILQIWQVTKIHFLSSRRALQVRTRVLSSGLFYTCSEPSANVLQACQIFKIKGKVQWENNFAKVQQYKAKQINQFRKNSSVITRPKLRHCRVRCARLQNAATSCCYKHVPSQAPLFLRVKIWGHLMCTENKHTWS